MAQYGLLDNSDGAPVISLSIALAIILTFFVALRFLARVKSRAAIAADDWWITGTLIPSYCMSACGILCELVSCPNHTNELTVIVVYKAGLGKPDGTLSADETLMFPKVG